MMGVWCACLVLPLTSAAEGGRPDGQAILFRVGSSFTLGSFDGATLGYQRFLGQDVAWRVILGIDLRYDNVEESEEHAGDGNNHNIDESLDYSEWGHEISISSEWLKYRGDRVSVFYGGGPRVSYSAYRDDGIEFYTSSGNWRFYRTNSKTYRVGLVGCFGVQWAATDWLALHAEYRVLCSYSHRVYDTERLVTNEENEEYDYDREGTVTDGFLLDSLGVRFGLSAYF
jgi:opacity protein-like surface antigen